MTSKILMPYPYPLSQMISAQTKTELMAPPFFISPEPPEPVPVVKGWAWGANHRQQTTFNPYLDTRFAEVQNVRSRYNVPPMLNYDTPMPAQPPTYYILSNYTKTSSGL